MVCVPCFIVPVLLFIWHKFIQPYVLRFWNPWAVKDADGNTTTEFPLACEGGVCAFSRKKPVENKDKSEPDVNDPGNGTNKDIIEPKEDNRLKSE